MAKVCLIRVKDTSTYLHCNHHCLALKKCAVFDFDNIFNIDPKTNWISTVTRPTTIVVAGFVLVPWDNTLDAVAFDSGSGYLKSRSAGYVTTNNDQLAFTEHVDSATVFELVPIELQGRNITEHIHQVHEQGFTVLPNVLTLDECNVLKSLLKLPTKSQKQCRRGDLFAIDSAFSELLHRIPVKPLVELLLCHDVKCATWSSNTLYPDANAHRFTPSWHVDYPYHNISPPYPTDPCHMLSVQTIWTLDDFTEHNGATLAVPGAHKSGTFPINLHGKYVNVEGKPIAQVLCGKGSVVVAHGGWWHSQGVNKSEESRTCLLGTFCKTWIEKKQ